MLSQHSAKMSRRSLRGFAASARNGNDVLRKGIEERGNEFDEFVGLCKELTPMGRISSAEGIAGMVCLLLHTEFFETGQHIRCSGGNSLLGQPRLLVTQDLS